jgi:tetratricopeptide (TPR) repeat protein
LEAQWPTIAAALPVLMQGAGSRLQTVCGALETFLEFSGRWDEQLVLDLQAEEKARAEGDFYNAGFRVYRQGSIYDLRAQAAEVVACAARVQQHWKQAPEAGAREKGIAIELRGRGNYLQRNYRAAAEAFREALAIDRAIEPESTDVAIDLNYLADAERGAGERGAAERDYKEALRISKKLNDRVQSAIVTGNLAMLAAEREDWKATEKLARMALELSGDSGPLEVRARGSALLALALARQGRKANCLPFARRAVELYTRVGASSLEWAKEILRECEG